MRPAGVWLAFLLAALFPLPAAAQTPAERRVEEKARAALDPAELALLKREGRLVFDYGIWINHLYSDFSDDDNDAELKDSTNQTYAMDQRVWLRATLRPPAGGGYENEHSLYIRLKERLTWREPADANGRFDDNGPHLDYGFLTLDARPAWLHLGRRLYQVGQGLAYNDLGDGAELLWSAPTWSLMALASRTLPHQDNVDLSVPGGKNSGRTFLGVEGRYIGITRHGVYGYALFQWDDDDEDPDDPAQDYDYDSQYFGLGSEGTLLPNLRYAAEAVFETGKGMTSGTNQRRNVRAWAMDVSLTYDVQLPTQPTLYGEYAFGSGDPDRVNVTDTVSGNRFGRDTNFLYFGYLPTGYALSPRLSNLRMFKVGAALKPLEAIPLFKELTVSADVYWYLKDEPEGGIFDLEAAQNDRHVGYELDLTLAWAILSDLSLAIEYGHFEPGDAYPAATNRRAEYFSVGVTTTF